MWKLLMVLSMQWSVSFVFAKVVESQSETGLETYHVAYSDEIGESREQKRDTFTLQRPRMTNTFTDVGMTGHELSEKVCKNIAEESLIFINSNEAKANIPKHGRDMTINFYRGSQFLNACQQGFMDGHSAYLRENKNKLKTQDTLTNFIKHLQEDPAIGKASDLCRDKYDLRKLNLNVAPNKIAETYLVMESRQKACFRGAMFQNSTEILRFTNEMNREIEKEKQKQ